MKPFIHLALFIFILISHNSFSQKISSQKGMTTVQFNVSQTAITVYLPSDIRPGDIISGSIKADPSGKNIKQQRTAMELLKKCKLTIGDPNTITRSLSALNPGQLLNLEKTKVSSAFIVSITDAENKTTQAEIKISQIQKTETLPGCSIPPYALMGSPLPIKGNFDGDASNTTCNLNGNPVPVIAESPRQCIVQMPENATGTNTMQVKENGQQTCTQNISPVKMTVEAGKLSLLTGEQTTVSIRIIGLKNLDKEPAKLTIENRTREIIVMGDGNDQLIILDQKLLKDSNEFRKDINVQSIRSGTFVINVNLDLPENNPPVFADVREPAPGKREDKVLTAATRTALELGWRKVHDVEETKQGEGWDCPNCFQCIKSRVFSSNVNAVGELGWGIITSFLSGGLKLTGSILNKIKDIAEKGGDIYKALKEMIDKGEIQVYGFAEKWCDNNEYCQVSGIVVYYVKTGCVEARFKCVGTKMCCANAETVYDLYYCLDKDGAVISDTVKMAISH